MRYERTLTVPKDEAKRAKAICEKAPGRDEVDRNSTVYDWEAMFDTGMVVAIQVCADSEPDEHTCWCQAVLFKQVGTEEIAGKTVPAFSEVSCSDVEELPFGEWEFEWDENEYVVTVVAATE
jgi:hypothetical protein